jgi:Bacterial lipid A biosynthesis acyltransferase
MRHVFHRLKIAIKGAAGLGFISIFRWLERHLTPGTFYSLLRPVFLARSTLNNAFKKTTPAPAVPDFLRTPRTIKTRILQRANIYLNGTIENFPDRLAGPGWKANCQFEGLVHLQEARRNGRPVVLATCHFGPYYLLHLWLRSMGLPAMGLVGGSSATRTHLARLQDRFIPLPEVPANLYLDQLRELAEFLAAGNLLCMTIDTPTGKQLAVPFCDGWDFQMATGAIRLAIHHQAELIPFSITDEGSWRYRITFGRPVPREALAPEADWAGAGKHLLGEMLPHFQAHPDQCCDAMTRRLIRKTGDARKS